MALSWLPSGRRGVRRAGLAARAAALLIPLFFGTTPPNTRPTGGDTPTLPPLQNSPGPDHELRGGRRVDLARRRPAVAGDRRAGHRAVEPQRHLRGYG